MRIAAARVFQRCRFLRKNLVRRTNMYCGFGRSDLAIKAAVQKDQRTQRVRVAQALQPSRFRIGDAGSRFRLSKKLIRAPPTGASKGLARDSRRVQLGYTRGEGVAVQNSQVSIVVFVNESMNASRQRVANQSKGVEVYGRWKQVERVLSARKPRRRSQQIVTNTS